MERLEQVVLDHFNTFNKGLYVTKIMEEKMNGVVMLENFLLLVNMKS